MARKSLLKLLKSLCVIISNTPPVRKFLDFVDRIQVRYFHKGQLKNHILTKYLIKDLFLYFFVAFLFFFMIFFVNQILITVEDLLSNKAPFKDVMKIMFYFLPAIIAQSTPFATLVGFLMSLGGMMSSNEILIFRASGFSFVRILVPVLVLGLFISVVSFFVNDYLLPLGNTKSSQLYREIISKTPTVELESNSVKTLDNSNLVIGEVNGKEVSDLVLFNNQNKETKIIIAGKSTLGSSESEGVLMELEMNDSVVISLNNSAPMDFDLIESEKAKLNVFDTAVFNTMSRQPREMTTVDLLRDLKRFKKIFDGSEYDKLRISIWEMEFHKKFSLPFGSLFFAFLAFSMAFLFGKHNGQTLGLFFGLVICVLYWAMQITGQIFVQKIRLDPFLCIWVPNFLVGLFGIIFFIKLIKK